MEPRPQSESESEQTRASTSVRSVRSKSNYGKTDRDSPSWKEKKVKDSKLKPSAAGRSTQSSSSMNKDDDDASRFISLAFTSSLDNVACEMLFSIQGIHKSFQI